MLSLPRTFLTVGASELRKSHESQLWQWRAHDTPRALTAAPPRRCWRARRARRCRRRPRRARDRRDRRRRRADLLSCQHTQTSQPRRQTRTLLRAARREAPSLAASERGHPQQHRIVSYGQHQSKSCRDTRRYEHQIAAGEARAVRRAAVRRSLKEAARRAHRRALRRTRSAAERRSDERRAHRRPHTGRLAGARHADGRGTARQQQTRTLQH